MSARLPLPAAAPLLVAAILCLAVGAPVEASPMAAKVAGLEARRGLLTLYPDPQAGKLWLELPAPQADGRFGTYVYYSSLLQGLGSNPVGLDRGQIGTSRLVTLRLLGGRLLVEEENTVYRAVSPDALERQAVRESFATSVLWAGEIAARDPDGRTLVDFTSFVVRDSHGVVAALRQAGQGSYSLDVGRSVPDLAQALAFPDNVELEALLTFTGTEPGGELRATVPSPTAVTVTAHQSFVRLPDEGYTPRPFDPRCGSFSVRYQDYASPFAEPVEKRLIVRHRLEKLDPKAARSRVKQPIVYYVDRGVPEPVRSALVEGAAWWAKAFEAAGFVDAYRVELLPEGVHPLDVRYNVIQWVHRATRGWSYGGGVMDPRTGERLKGHVNLGSLRVRHDRLLFEGLVGVAATGKGGPNDPLEVSLARIRQLSAHEVGHALGLVHNYAASTYDDRASVMDYPAPLVQVDARGELDLSRAYGVGVGSWDVHAIRCAYEPALAGESETGVVNRLAAEGLARGLLFITDADARPLGSAHPRAHLWDNGADPVAELEHVLRVRRLALGRFGTANLASGLPVALLEEVFATVYLHHRYQTEAAVKVLSGVDYRYAAIGEAAPEARPVEAAWQRRALDQLLAALDPSELDVPEPALRLLLPRPSELDPNREMFAGQMRPTFDPLAAAGTAADLVLIGLLDPTRAARLVDQHRRDASLPGLEEVLERLKGKTFAAWKDSGRLGEIRRVTQTAVLARLLDLHLQGSPSVKARVGAVLRQLAAELGKASEGAQKAHETELAAVLGRYLTRGEVGGQPLPRPLDPPPGMPIGSASQDPEGCSHPVWMEH